DRRACRNTRLASLAQGSSAYIQLGDGIIRIDPMWCKKEPHPTLAVSVHTCTPEAGRPGHMRWIFPHLKERIAPSGPNAADTRRQREERSARVDGEKRPPLVQLENLHKTYTTAEIPVHAVRGISLSISHGELVAIMGASGSGKSTLMNILGCLDRPTSGTYLLEGVDVSTLDRDRLADLRNQKLGFIFQ